ncbi:hypothetical protein PCASD_13719 [Puccinia coronata f. sp. avenae]|uniref:Uncharacterized protein n=1 Tax=Puccinia coronata f. sp. avenae TaxID=200324 RepID=A0A2N5UF99_9BASI|nr:hypothetical protein PCASD_13719 [Puccinia coronata f. sp. avenae]
MPHFHSHPPPQTNDFYFFPYYKPRLVCTKRFRELTSSPCRFKPKWGSMPSNQHHPLNSSHQTFEPTPSSNTATAALRYEKRQISSSWWEFNYCHGVVGHAGNHLQSLDKGAPKVQRQHNIYPDGRPLCPSRPTLITAASSSSASSSPTNIFVCGGIEVTMGQASTKIWILCLHTAKLIGRKAPLTDSTEDAGGPLKAPLGHLVFSGLVLAIMMSALTIMRCKEPAKLLIQLYWPRSQLWLLIEAWHVLLISVGLLALAVVSALLPRRLSVPALSTLARHRLSNGHSTKGRKLKTHHTLSRSTHAWVGLAIAIIGLVGVPPSPSSAGWTNLSKKIAIKNSCSPPTVPPGSSKQKKVPASRAAPWSVWSCWVGILSAEVARSIIRKHRKDERASSSHHHPCPML